MEPDDELTLRERDIIRAQEAERRVKERMAQQEIDKHKRKAWWRR